MQNESYPNPAGAFVPPQTMAPPPAPVPPLPTPAAPVKQGKPFRGVFLAIWLLLFWFAMIQLFNEAGFVGASCYPACVEMATAIVVGAGVFLAQTGVIELIFAALSAVAAAFLRAYSFCMLELYAEDKSSGHDFGEIVGKEGFFKYFFISLLVSLVILALAFLLAKVMRGGGWSFIAAVAAGGVLFFASSFLDSASGVAYGLLAALELAGAAFFTKDLCRAIFVKQKPKALGRILSIATAIVLPAAVLLYSAISPVRGYGSDFIDIVPVIGVIVGAVVLVAGRKLGYYIAMFSAGGMLPVYLATLLSGSADQGYALASALMLLCVVLLLLVRLMSRQPKGAAQQAMK